MLKFGVSQPVRRKEDSRFLTGAGQFIDDGVPADALQAHFVLSPVAHAVIGSIDVEAAKSASGVRTVITADDLERASVRNRLEASILSLPGGGKAADPPRPVLAKDKVRFVGEPVALVVADSLNQAKDATELIEIDFEELPAHLELKAGGEEIHKEAPGNLAFDWWEGDQSAVDEAFSNAAHKVSLVVEDNRIIANSLEPRGCSAEWANGRLLFSYGGQGVWSAKKELKDVFGLESESVHVKTPDVGGGFGMKGFMYPEYFAVAHAARVAGRPVHWQSSRSEAMLLDNAGRDLVSLVEAAFDKDFKLLAYRAETDCNLGAQNSNFGQSIQTEIAQKVLTGVYDIPAVFFQVRGHYTNTTPVDAYRGAGRPEAIYMIERLMDHAARTLGVDPLELRRRNFIPPEKFPYRNFGRETFDVGEFARVLGRAETESDMPGFRARKAKARADGKLRGVGICYYIEAILGDKSETTKIEFADDGGVDVYVGTQSNGQGHETAYSQVLHERAGIPFENIRYVQGDSDLIRQGGGTGGSRSVTAQSVSINAAADRAIEAFVPFVAELFDVDADRVSFDDGLYRAEGSNRSLSLIDAADAARAQGHSDLLTASARTTLDGRSYPNGAHVCEVEIDQDTGDTRVVKYTVVDDLGVLMNPLLAEGQVHGGVAQGIGQAVTERVVFDESGQLLSGTFMDYAMPRAADIPLIDFHSEPVPTKNNPIGMKGCGEAGTIGALAAVANAVQDALWESGVRRVDMPFTPQRTWELISG